MSGLSDKHRKDLQAYVDFYKGKEDIYGDTGWPMSIAHAIEAALRLLDVKGSDFVCAACGSDNPDHALRCLNCGHDQTSRAIRRSSL